MTYVNREKELMQGSTDVINNSSDVIESLFGIWKSKKSPNKQCGITPFILMIPLYPMIAEREDAKTFDFKERLCRIRMRDVAEWAAQNIPHHEGYRSKKNDTKTKSNIEQHF